MKNVNTYVARKPKFGRGGRRHRARPRWVTETPATRQRKNVNTYVARKPKFGRGGRRHRARRRAKGRPS